jgi:hypothetical protein
MMVRKMRQKVKKSHRWRQAAREPQEAGYMPLLGQQAQKWPWR